MKTIAVQISAVLTILVIGRCFGDKPTTSTVEQDLVRFAAALEGNDKSPFYEKSLRELFSAAGAPTSQVSPQGRNASMRVVLNWYQTKRESRANEMETRVALAGFVGYLEGAFNIKAPSWWRAAVLDGQFDHTKDTQSFFSISPSFYDSLKDGHGEWKGDITTEVLQEGRKVVVPSRVFNTRMPLTLEVKFDGAPYSVSALQSSKRVFVVYNTGASLSGAVACFDADGALQWSRPVWGTLASDLSGPVTRSCRLEVDVNNGVVTVWGGGYATCYCERFDAADGSVLSRFVSDI